MQTWIDVEDASGNKYGDGPILTATAWQSTRRLDAAGTFSFEMPASDPRAANLRNKRIVRCWSSDKDGIVERGAGIIDSIEVSANPKGPTMLKVSGDDILRELVYRDVGQLELFERIVGAATLTVSGNPVVLPEYIDLDTATPLVVGYAEPFHQIDFTISNQSNWIDSTTKAFFYNEVSSSWIELNIKENTTYILGIVPFAQSGHLSFDVPSGWGMQDGLYQIRITCPQHNIGHFWLTGCDVHCIRDTADALEKVMALAPDGWTLDSAGAFATENSVNYPMSGGTVLAALRRLAQQTGEHFRLGVSGRRVHWLGSTIQSSGLRAIAASESAPVTMLITELRQITDTYELFTRVYLYGGGEGIGRLTLANTSRAAPNGYSLSAAESYIEHVDARSQYGRIDVVTTYSDIVPNDMSAAANRTAADTLFDRGIQLLARRSQLQHAYAIKVVPSTEPLFPGQTVYINYDEWFEQYHAVAIHQDMTVLEVTQIVSDAGILTAELVVATVDFFPWSDDMVVAESLADVQIDRSKRLPQASYSSDARGVPTYIATENGLVVALKRVTPIPDGTYDLRVNPWVTFLDGVPTHIS